jgi:hypothetical protein
MRWKMVGDCAVRAVAVTFDLSYDEAFCLLDALPNGCVRSFERKIGNKVTNGWQLRPVCQMAESGRYICTECRGGHVVAYIDGVRYDTVPGQSPTRGFGLLCRQGIRRATPCDTCGVLPPRTRA